MHFTKSLSFLSLASLSIKTLGQRVESFTLSPTSLPNPTLSSVASISFGLNNLPQRTLIQLSGHVWQPAPRFSGQGPTYQMVKQGTSVRRCRGCMTLPIGCGRGVWGLSHSSRFCVLWGLVLVIWQPEVVHGMTFFPSFLFFFCLIHMMRIWAYCSKGHNLPVPQDHWYVHLIRIVNSNQEIPFNLQAKFHWQ